MPVVVISGMDEVEESTLDVVNAGLVTVGTGPASELEMVESSLVVFVGVSVVETVDETVGEA